jgi:hypothetical protein
MSLVRQPLHEYPSHRLNVRHLPSLPISKLGATNGQGASSNAISSTNRFHANNLFLQSLTAPTNNTNQVQQPKKIVSRQNKYGFDPIHNKPRQITIVKQGNEKPHRSITILLNRRTVQTYDQLLSDISESFGYQKNRTDKVRKNERRKKQDQKPREISFFSSPFSFLLNIKNILLKRNTWAMTNRMRNFPFLFLSSIVNCLTMYSFHSNTFLHIQVYHYSIDQTLIHSQRKTS